EREIDLQHLRLVDLARQVVLGLIDLGAHVRERGLGVEPGLELEQDEAAALEGGRAHLLHVADRLELGLDRPQQEPLGILRADAALGELHVDDRNPDVRLRLFRDRHIGDQAGAQQKQERRDGEPRVADGVVDEPGHHTTLFLNGEWRVAQRLRPVPYSPFPIRYSLPLPLLRDRGELGYSHRVDALAFAHEVLSLHDHAAAIGKAGDPHEALLVLDYAAGSELDRGVAVDNAQAEIAGGGKGERRAWDARRQNGQQRHDDLRRDAVGNVAVGVGQFDLDPIGARGRARGLGHEPDFSAGAL